MYLHFHGGGMVSGSPEMMDLMNQHLAKQFGVAVVSADYRKAPEHPFPAGPDDGVAVGALSCSRTGAREFGIGPHADRRRIGRRLHDRDHRVARSRRAATRSTASTASTSSSASSTGAVHRASADSGRTTGSTCSRRAGIGFMADCYLPGRTADERRAPEISPAYADLRELPPCLVSVGSCDHLVDDSLLFAARAAAAGVDVDLFVAPDMPHGFFAFDCGITRLWFEHQARVARRPPRAVAAAAATSGARNRPARQPTG